MARRRKHPPGTTRQGIRDLGSAPKREGRREPYCWHVWDLVADSYYLDYGQPDVRAYEKCIKCGAVR